MKLIFSPTRLTVLVFVSVIVFGSCKKETSADTSQEEFASQASSEADAESDDIFNEVFDNVMGVNTDVAFGGTGVFGRMNNSGTAGETARLNACPDVTITHLSNTEWHSMRTITQIEGRCTSLIPLDDIYEIRGGSGGKVKRGDLLIAWNAEITEPLIKKFTCRWLVKGIIRIARLNLTTNSPWVAAINYGNGDCDNKAIATINGISHIITLP